MVVTWSGTQIYILLFYVAFPSLPSLLCPPVVYKNSRSAGEGQKSDFHLIIWPGGDRRTPPAPSYSTAVSERQIMLIKYFVKKREFLAWPLRPCWNACPVFYRVFPDMEILLTKISPSVNLRNCWNSFEKEEDKCEHWTLQIKVLCNYKIFYFAKNILVQKILIFPISWLVPCPDPQADTDRRCQCGQGCSCSRGC